jgi:hypothetical protein
MATSALHLPVRPDPGQSRGLLRVVSNQEMFKAEQLAAQAAKSQEDEFVEKQLVSHIRGRMSDMRNFRNSEGIGERLLDALRTYKGQYNPTRLQEISQFGGSRVYARVTATKCRAGTALLRDIYLGAERPWDIDPTPEPRTPEDIEKAVQELVNIEVATNMQAGMPVDQQAVADRTNMLRRAAKRAAKKQAVIEAENATNRLDDILIEGGFYEALAEFLIDMPIFPFACLKGPVIRNVTRPKWVNGQMQMQTVPQMFWNRVSPFDIYWSPGAVNTKQAEFIERIRLTRAELLALRDLPGYNREAIDEVLARFYNTGFHDWWDAQDSQRAEMENRERWSRTSSSMLDTAEYTGYVSGKLLKEWGMDETKVQDESAEYFVTAWLIDRYVIKVQINPVSRQTAPYYITSFEKIPGSIYGYGLPDLLEDVQEICNAAARAVVNNSSIASGPQVVINDEVMQPGENDNLFPWKRWHVSYDPSMVTSSAAPVTFFQPTMNTNELMAIYEKWNMMGDEISAIPRYMTGNEKVGGAGRTASGLAMLMGNAAKTLQNVAASIDRDLFMLIMETQPGAFRGDEFINVKGVNHAVKREQDRMRQLEFLQLTANPFDMQLIGPEGRANILRSVASNLGLEHEQILPDDEEITARLAEQRAQAEQQAQQGAAQQQASGENDASQKPRPKDNRAGPEQVRQQTGVEDQFTNQATGRPGMRAGG